MPYGPYQHIKVDVAQQILTLRLHRPEKLNAFTATMMTELIDGFTRVNSDDDVRVIIVTGEGRAFCARAHLSGGASKFDATKNPEGAARTAGAVDQLAWSDERVRDGGRLVPLAIFE